MVEHNPSQTQMSVDFYATSSASHDVLILPVQEDRKLFKSAKPLDQGASGLYSKILGAQDAFTKEDHSKTIEVSLRHEDLPYSSVLFVVAHSDKLQTAGDYELLGAKIIDALNGDTRSAAIVSGAYNHAEVKANDAAAAMINGMALKAYRFTKYKTKDKDRNKGLAKLSVLCGDDVKAVSTAFKSLYAVTNASFEARNLVTEPANKINPVTYADAVKALFKGTDVKVKVLDDKKMTKMGMEAIVSVGMASANPSRMVIMEYNGVGKDSKIPSAAFVGKGVTFDTGGISLKPGAGMEDMKFDMAGSAAVVGVMKALADRGAKVHIVGAIGLAENMIADNAYRPSDVLKSYSGQTIEIINTDAEGRLVLADTLTYVQQEYKPQTIIDLATLTGAMLVALGHEYAGTYTTTDTLYADLEKAGQAVEEYVWRMPLSKEYDKMLDSPIADMRNLATSRYAGSCTAAAFLQRFVNDDVEWAHIDIAGTAWRTAARSFAPKGATGYGVRLLNEFVRVRYEKI